MATVREAGTRAVFLAQLFGVAAVILGIVWDYEPQRWVEQPQWWATGAASTVCFLCALVCAVNFWRIVNGKGNLRRRPDA